jgi:hypothetical protein
MTRGVTPLPPQFRARAFIDARGKRRFGISLSLNGNRFIGSALLRNNARADSGVIASLLESLAASLRRG